MNQRDIAFKILYDVFAKKGYLNIVLNKYLNNDEIEDVDKSFIKEIVFGPIERKYTLDHIIDHYSTRGIKKIDDKVLIILEMGLFQLMYMDKVPDYAAINESVNLAKKYVGKYASKFVNAVLRSYLRNTKQIKFLQPDENLTEYLSFKYSFPEWIVKRLLNNYDRDATESILESLNGRPEISIRINTLKIDGKSFEKKLKYRGLNYKKGLYNDEAYYIGLKNITNDEMYNDGLIQVQDEGAMIISKVLSPEPDDMVMDVCSAPGGKTTHLSQLMNNKGKIVAFDIYEHKIDLIKRNCRRLGIDNIDALVFDSTNVNSEYIDKADKVLVDVPCSGIGIIRKKPDIKLKNYTEKDFEELNNIQYRILSSSSKYVKRGGYILYSTCTIGREENMNVVDKFLNENKEFKISDIRPFLPEKLISYVDDRGCIQLLPNINNTDGFFICKMQRNN
ncbi:MAG: rRNA (cytosine967-C5)-methyltransferase [Thermoanaerobacterium sp.]|uniref:16S rRNA (cytosine(967)-C(5))-methyltransferase RsmB n=1 Tax=Thermoanaerobacterium sp. CMT5567-10 TaxID=3061989 RepID=UPI0024AA7DF7|nr:16S rRNA (cytosine(967)-C(5))-methyltransferase RsmB [Thermoanaerobacterium sp. CMT5567-10]MDI3476985.1 rRNA (cytosine967-C5)-methyltransferase [Thermoanaerobacterium sp.]MDK2806694.1 rRNA (cytosine967-C5)-methyltransferase [Thermoanaerobacterium sp.]MDN5315981.1 rRNA (cytosine967-C5)-methyltransferase [Thermoanaerobacterium sp.]WKV09200.1 16S rRNA (cytosine(967)-C(5))-methyltransferase RsmB [Thermoanaerobacterium sp. CMT5567-10]WLY85426.1 16S rRNA (cytosine(967)-C(5))-methyltransferase Rsm